MARDEREEATQQEIREDAVREPDDRQTAREELELDLMAADASELGEDIGQPTE